MRIITLILRLWEPYGRHCRVGINTIGHFSYAEETDLLERGMGKVDINALSFYPFEIKTVVLRNWTV